VLNDIKKVKGNDRYLI